MMTLPDVLGLPPTANNDTAGVLYDSMPIVEFIPCNPHFQQGLNLFTVTPAWSQYLQLLNDLGYNINNKSKSLKVAVQADSFPLTDVFTNDYSASFLEQLLNVVSSGAQDLQQIVGGRTFGQTLSNTQKILSNMGTIGGEVSSGLGDLIKAVNGSQISKSISNQTKNLLSSLLGGSRTDFPAVWKNSTFGQTYTFSIKLLTLDLQDGDSLQQYIAGPLAAILLLATPQTNDGTTFNYPFFIKVKCTGLINILAGAISEISVTRGDENQIGYTQTMGLITIKLTVVNLYHSLMVGLQNYSSNERPTLQNYINGFIEGRSTYDDHNPINEQDQSGNISTTNSIFVGVQNLTTSITSRVSSIETDVANSLSSLMPTI